MSFNSQAKLHNYILFCINLFFYTEHSFSGFIGS